MALPGSTPADDLDAIRLAIVALVETQGRVLDTLHAHGVQQDGVTAALTILDSRIASLDGRIGELISAVTTRAEGADGSTLSAVVDQLTTLNQTLTGLAAGTAEIGRGVARLTALLPPTEG